MIEPIFSPLQTLQHYLVMNLLRKHLGSTILNPLPSFWFPLLASTQSFLASCWSASLISDLLFRLHIPGIPIKTRALGPMTKTIRLAFTNPSTFIWPWSFLGVDENKYADVVLTFSTHLHTDLSCWSLIAFDLLSWLHIYQIPKNKTKIGRLVLMTKAICWVFTNFNVILALNWTATKI